jgi:glutamyl-tRNA synthetase
MYNAFGWEPPEFAHVGLLQTSDQQKLSKRNQDTDIESYRKQGILPSALVNFVSLLGWSHNLGSDILTIERLIENVRGRFTK